MARRRRASRRSSLDGRPLRIEYAWVGARARARRCSCSCTRAWARSRCGRTIRTRCARRRARAGSCTRVRATGSRRRGRPREKWPVDFMHRQAHDVLPALLSHLALDAWPWLFGHSDGASIALLYAAAYPDRVAGVIAVAPHIFVEDVSIRSIDAARVQYGSTGLARAARPVSRRSRLGVLGLERHLARPCVSQLEHRGRGGGRSAARCWPCRARTTSTARWRRSRASRAWFRRRALVKLPACGHSPHRDQPAALTRGGRVVPAPAWRRAGGQEVPT